MIGQTATRTPRRTSHGAHIRRSRGTGPLSGRHPVNSVTQPHQAGPDPVRVVVIEDNRLACERLAALLDGHADFKIAATAVCVTSGLAPIRETQPHVTLVNAALGHVDGQISLKGIKDLAPETRVVLMDVHAVQDDVIAFIKAGANGFILKDATVHDFVGTIRSVAQGMSVVPAALTPTLLSYIAGQPTGGTPQGSVPQAATRMTKREREITQLIADGLTNKEIAQRLNIATYTAKSHVHNILKKLALHTRLQLAAHTRRAGAPTCAPDPGSVMVVRAAVPSPPRLAVPNVDVDKRTVRGRRAILA